MIRAALLMAALVLPLAAEDALGGPFDQPRLQAVSEAHTKSVAFVTYTMYIEQGGRELEQELNTIGTVVDSSGVVVISGQSIAPTIRQRGQVRKIEPQIRDITVVIEGKTYEAKIAIKEFQHDRVLLRVGPEEGEDEIAEGRSFSAVALGGKAPVMGEPVVILSRLGEKNDYAAQVVPARVSGITEVPQVYYNLGFNTGNFGAAPVFDLSGVLLGFTGMRTELNATGQVLTTGMAGMVPPEGLTEMLKKVPDWDNLMHDEPLGDEEEPEAPATPEGSGDFEE